MGNNKTALPMKGIHTPRFFIWFRGFWHGKIIHTGGIDPETNTIASGYVTGQIKRFRNACVTRREKAEETVGLINMLETPVYELDVEDSVASVAQKMNADMSGIDVVWYCCGDFGTAQPKLSANEKTQMRSFYEQLFMALGAKSVTFKEDLPSDDCYHFAETPVSCMAVEGTVSGLMDLTVLEPEIFEDADETILEAPIVIPEEQVSYKPDSAEFIDPDSALATIQPVADFLLEHPEVNLLLYGTCAGESDSEYTLWLGKARAESVKTALVEAGVNANRIVAVTVKAADDPYYQFGLGTGAEAGVNRKTVMIDMSTELAQQIMSNAI